MAQTVLLKFSISRGYSNIRAKTFVDVVVDYGLRGHDNDYEYINFKFWRPDFKGEIKYLGDNNNSNNFNICKSEVA